MGEEKKDANSSPRNGNLKMFVDVERLATNRQERIAALETVKSLHSVSGAVEVTEISKPLSTAKVQQKNLEKDRF